MDGRAFRFLHAGDFRLDTPFIGLGNVPEHLIDPLIDAPYKAAEEVFDAAIVEDVAFILLSGGIVQPQRAGARAIVFLREQFERLAENKIEVYWAGGGADSPENLASVLELPEHVHLFPQSHVEEVVHHDDVGPLAVIMGKSSGGRDKLRAGEYRGSPGTFDIVVYSGHLDTNALSGLEVDYWAMGGRADRKTLVRSPHQVHYAGSPQGRSPQEVGAHGATLVTVDSDGSSRTQLVPCDQIRWLSERVELPPTATRRDLEKRLRDRVRGLTETASSRQLLVSWQVVGGQRISHELAGGTLAEEMLSDLQKEFGHRSPAVWSVSLAHEGAGGGIPDSFYDEDTILGDFLRSVRDARQDTAARGEIAQRLDPSPEIEGFDFSLDLTDEINRDELLAEVEALGAELLRG